MPSLPTPEAWAQIRYDYEHTDRPVMEICVEHRITANTLRLRARRWGWRMRRARIPAEGPPAVAPVDAGRPSSPLPWGEVGEQRSCEPGEAVTTIDSPEPPHPNPLPQRERERTEFAAAHGPYVEPSPHISAPIAPAVDDTAPIGQRLQGAVARVLPAIETTLARLSAGPIQPREMETAARALGSLTRTLRELNGLLGQHKAERQSLARKLEAIIAERDDPPPEDRDEFRNELARRLENVVASHEAQIPARYEAAWNEFAAEAGQ